MNGFYKIIFFLLFNLFVSGQLEANCKDDDQISFAKGPNELYRIHKPPQQACWRDPNQAELLIKHIEPEQAQVILSHLDKASGKEITNKILDTVCLVIPGHYKIYVKAPAYTTKVFEIDLEDDEKYCLDVRLEKAH